MRYAYPAVFYQGKDAVTVYFPDLACLSQGKDYLQAFQNAREGLSLHIYGMLEDEEKLPAVILKGKKKFYKVVNAIRN